MEKSEIIKKLEELEKIADNIANLGEYAKAAGMYKIIFEMWKFIRSNE